MHKDNRTWFNSHADTYADGILAIQRTFYENSAGFLNMYLPDNGTVLDLGNGGLINYDYQRLQRLDCADIVVNLV